MAETQPDALVAPVVNGPAAKLQPELPTQDQTTDPSTSTDSGSPPTAKLIANPYPLFVFPSNLPCPPFIDVPGVSNFRSLGGYQSADGRRLVRHNLFYRCAHPVQITNQGLQQLTSKLNVKAIYDLRSEAEVVRTAAGVAAAAAQANIQPDTTANSESSSVPAPIPEIPSASSLFESLRHFNPVYATDDYSPEALARKLGWYTRALATSDLPYEYSEGFVNAYRDIALHGVPAYTTMFRHILNRPSDPFVFHCTAGKDRTGVFAAMLLRLAGVDDETISWEYALTEPGLGAWRLQFIERMVGGAGNSQQEQNGPSSWNKMSRQEAARVSGSRAGSMRAFLTLVLDGELGGTENYLMKNCGFSEEEVSAIKKNIVIDKTEAGEDVIVQPCSISGWTPYGGCVDN